MAKAESLTAVTFTPAAAAARSLALGQADVVTVRGDHDHAQPARVHHPPGVAGLDPGGHGVFPGRHGHVRPDLAVELAGDRVEDPQPPPAVVPDAEPVEVRFPQLPPFGFQPGHLPGAVYVEPSFFIPHHNARLGPDEYVLEVALDALAAAAR